MAQVTIAGKEFEIDEPYTEGHVLTAGEAAALNQTYRENVRNNMAAKVKDGAGQDEVTQYATEYEFGVRTGGGRTTADPVMREAINLAKTAIKAFLKANNKTADKEAIQAKAEELANNPEKEYMARARRIVEEQRNAASIALDEITL